MVNLALESKKRTLLSKITQEIIYEINEKISYNIALGNYHCDIPYELIGDTYINPVVDYLKLLGYEITQIKQPIKPDWFEITHIRLSWSKINNKLITNNNK